MQIKLKNMKPEYIVTALEEYDHESGLRVILYQGDDLIQACTAIADCGDYRNPALYRIV